MIVKEYCRYIRSYSELEGLQLAHTLCYSARRTESGIVLELKLEQGGSSYASRVLCPAENFPRAMRLMKYLCENGIGPGQWLDVLNDLHQPYQPFPAPEVAPMPKIAESRPRFVAFV